MVEIFGADKLTDDDDDDVDDDDDDDDNEEDDDDDADDDEADAKDDNMGAYMLALARGIALDRLAVGRNGHW